MAWQSSDATQQLRVRMEQLREGTVFGGTLNSAPAQGKALRFLACGGGINFAQCYDAAQDREDVTVNLINAIYAAVDATDIFKQTDGFALLAGQDPVKDVADALKAGLTVTLAQRCLNAPYEAPSSSSNADRRRALEALLAATKDDALKNLPRDILAANPERDCWQHRLKEAGLPPDAKFLPKGSKKPSRGERSTWQYWVGLYVAKALSEFEEANVEGSAASRDAAETLKRDLARGDYSAVVAVLEEMLRRKITAVGSDEAAVAKWLTKTAKRAASKFSTIGSVAGDASVLVGGHRTALAARLAAGKKRDLAENRKNDGTARDNADDPSRELREKLDRLTSHTRLRRLRGRRAPPPEDGTAEPPTAPELAAAAADVAEEDVAPGGAEASAGGASSEA